MRRSCFSPCSRPNITCFCRKGQLLKAWSLRRAALGCSIAEANSGFDSTMCSFRTSKLSTEAQIDAVEGNRGANLKVDQEGGVKATESKTRLLRPVVAGLIAAKSMDNDEGKAQPESNYCGRSLGGASGFGLAGAFAAQSSRYVGSALGFYGLAWSVYRNVIARGQEVEFQPNTALDVRFGSRGAKRTEKAPLKMRERAAR